MPNTALPNFFFSLASLSFLAPTVSCSSVPLVEAGAGVASPPTLTQGLLSPLCTEAVSSPNDLEGRGRGSVESSRREGEGRTRGRATEGERVEVVDLGSLEGTGGFLEEEERFLEEKRERKDMVGGAVRERREGTRSQ